MFNTFFSLHRIIYRASAKKTLKSILHGDRLRITQETFQIALFASMLLSSVKKTALKFLFTVLSYVQGALRKRIGTTYLIEYVQGKIKKHWQYRYSALFILSVHY